MPRTARKSRLPRSPRPLTPRQEAFVRDYLSNGRNAAAAYRSAYNAANQADGTVRVNACRLLQDPRIVERIAAVVVAVEKETELSVARVLDRLQEEGDYHGDDASHAARVSAWKAIGLHLGMFVKRLEHSGPDGKPIPHEDVTLTDEEVAERLRALWEEAQRHKAAGNSKMADDLDAIGNGDTDDAEQEGGGG